jgi:hypothetical protein
MRASLRGFIPNRFKSSITNVEDDSFFSTAEDSSVWRNTDLVEISPDIPSKSWLFAASDISILAEGCPFR